MGICERFPSLTPLDIRMKRFGEVMLLVRRINGFSPEKKQSTKKIRRPAGDDWF
ncbi:MAG: hypothetical protein MJ000_11730 [Bacteroidales bacterium]|nr:hypothetical protein [Bacteroidales bacterium]